MSLSDYFSAEMRRRYPNWDGKFFLPPAIQSIVGKTIVPPANETALYKPNKLIVTATSLGNTGWKFVVNEELHKFENDSLGLQVETIVLKSSFRMTGDIDSVYQKWSVQETLPAHGLSKEQIGRLNGTRSATHCCVCGAKLIPLWGMILWCPTCEKD